MTVSVQVTILYNEIEYYTFKINSSSTKLQWVKIDYEVSLAILFPIISYTNTETHMPHESIVIYML